MSSKLDQSLDSIIDSNRQTQKSNKSSNKQSNNDKKSSNGPIRKSRNSSANQRSTPYSRERDNRSGNRSNNQSNRQPFSQSAPHSNSPWASNMFIPPVIMPSSAAAPVVTQKVIGDTIHVSNLDKTVTADDLNDIFKPCGTIKSVNVHFDQTGSSIGTATITFNRKNDAAKAVDEFDGAEVDGRTMHIKLIGEVVKQTQSQPKVAQPMNQFPALTPQMMQQFAAFQSSQMRMPSQQQPRNQSQQSNRPQPRGNTNVKRGGRGGARGAAAGRRPGPGRGEKKTLSAEDLDAQMDTYHSKNAKSDAAPAPAAESTEAA